MNITRAEKIIKFENFINYLKNKVKPLKDNVFDLSDKNIFTLYNLTDCTVEGLVQNYKSDIVIYLGKTQADYYCFIIYNFILHRFIRLYYLKKLFILDNGDVDLHNNTPYLKCNINNRQTVTLISDSCRYFQKLNNIDNYNFIKEYIEF